MEKVRNKNKKVLIILSLIIFFMICVFTTLAYFRYTYKSEPIIITTTDLKLNITINDIINNKNIQPTTWSSNMDENNNNTNIAQVDLNVNSNSKINATYTVNINGDIVKNPSYTGGEISDIKYKVYDNNNNFISEGEFTDTTNIKIIDGMITTDGNLNKDYIIYIYIDETGEVQNSLKDISFNIKFTGEANQIEE